MQKESGAEEGARLRGLPPLDTKGARILVLGSFPSVSSLEKSEYYAHQRNHFWPILATIALQREKRAVGAGSPKVEDAPPDWPSRVVLAMELGLAIWDLVASCERSGSLDTAIKNPTLNDIDAFVAERPSLGCIVLNGSAASAFFAKRFAPGSGLESAAFGEARPIRLGGRDLLARRLPSTSPVPTARFRKIADKLSLWKQALQEGIVE